MLAGHVHHDNGRGPFYNLAELQPGQEIIARGDGVEYRYRVSWVEIMAPSAVEVTEPSDVPIMTLISCANWDAVSWSYTDRVVVRAEYFDQVREN